MALEDLTGTKYIDDLVSTNPAAGDNVSEGDDHIRGIKNVLKTTFPSIDGAITPSDTELNYMGGVTSSVQTQFDAITANNWVTNARMADDAITGAEIADDSINSEHYVDGSIDTAHIADDQVTYAKMQNVSATDRILGRDSSGAGVVEEITPANVRTMINVEDGADVTDTANVTSAGALMDSECANLAAVKAINQGLATTDNVTHNNLTVSGDLTVNGTTTTVNTANLAVEDPLIALATGNSSADAVDIGMYGLYDTSGSQDLYGGIFRDANDSGKWKIFKDNQAAPTTTVDTSGTGYATGTLVADVEVPTGSSASFADSSKAKFGTGNDLEIYHDGSHSYVHDAGTGDLKLQSEGNILLERQSGGGATMLKAVVDGAVELYHDNTKKLETTSNGVLMPNNQEIRFKDNGGNERTAVMYDSSNTLSVGTSTGNLDLIGGGSYAPIMRISGSNKHGTYSNTGSQPTNEGVWHVENNNNSCNMHVNNSKSSGYGDNLLRLQSSQDSSNGSYNIFNCRNGGGAVLRIEDSGNVKNANNSYGSLSDERIKQDIADASSQWDDIKAVKIRKYKLKKLVNRDGADNTPYHIGVVAQELESAGISNLVNETKPEKEDVALHSDFGTIDSEGVFTEGENVKEVKYSVLYMKSIKALQEAMARIETLEAKVTALENA